MRPEWRVVFSLIEQVHEEEGKAQEHMYAATLRCGISRNLVLQYIAMQYNAWRL